MQNKPLRVVVAMSGGVDSSVAAALLADQGHEVIGVMMKLWSDPGTENLCCTPDSMALARSIAAQFDFPFHTADVESTFRQNVVEYFIDQYKSGSTPNPCIACNRHVRWNTLFDIADTLGATHVASGHYARLKMTGKGLVQLLRGIDPNKDQSYVLHGLSQEQLTRTLFPLGKYTKPEIREIARRFQLPVSEHPDSQDLCFVGKDGYRDFLIRHAPEVVDPGPIVNSRGEHLGTHQGLAFYTIGQRKGLGIPAPRSYYVMRKDTGLNTLVIGSSEELGRDELIAEDVNWIAGTAPIGPMRVQIKIRYKAHDVWGLVYPQPGCSVFVKFEERIRAITPGQAAVFYQDTVCLGGGIIK
jgi:tRNA-specific 2-thiouridylase